MSFEVDLLRESICLTVIFASIVVINFAARVILRLLKFEHGPFGDRGSTAFWITAVAVAAECGVMSLRRPTIVSIVFGLIFAFICMHMPERVEGEEP